MMEALRLADDRVAELTAADRVAAATPVHDHDVPAAPEAWVDHIVRKGMTPESDGTGLAPDKKATLRPARARFAPKAPRSVIVTSRPGISGRS